MTTRTILLGLWLALGLLAGLPPARSQTRPAPAPTAAEPRARVLAGGYGNHADGPGPMARFYYPTGVALGPDGVLYVADTENNRIRRVQPDGQVSTLAGTGEPGSLDGPVATAQFTRPMGIAVDARGTVYVTENYTTTIRVISPDGRVSTLADTSPAAVAAGEAVRFVSFSNIAVDAAGVLYLSDYSQGVIHKITPAGKVSSLPKPLPPGFSTTRQDTIAAMVNPSAVAVAADGTVYVADAGDKSICTISPAGRLRILAGGERRRTDRKLKPDLFHNPEALAVAADGTVYVADTGTQRIRKVTPDGQVSTLSVVAQPPGSPLKTAFGPGNAVNLEGPWGMALAPDGTLYVSAQRAHRLHAIAPNGQLRLLAGAGEATHVDAPGPAARFQQPFGVAVAHGGTVYVADTDNHCIRKITADGVVSTLAGTGEAGFADGPGAAARFARPVGVAVGPGDTVYVADTGNHRIRRISPRGQVSTLAGSGRRGFANGAGPAARFTRPTGVAVASNGTVYVADSADYIRRIAPGGRVSTAVDLTPQREPSNYGAVTVAPFGVAVVPGGTLYVTGSLTARVYKITPKGKVSIVAGCGPGCDAYEEVSSAPSFRNPIGLAAAPDGTLYVTDPINHTVRRIAPGGRVSVLINDHGRPAAAPATGRLAPAQPQGVAVDAAGKVYIADTENNRILVVW